MWGPVSSVHPDCCSWSLHLDPLASGFQSSCLHGEASTVTGFSVLNDSRFQHVRLLSTCSGDRHLLLVQSEAEEDEVNDANEDEQGSSEQHQDEQVPVSVSSESQCLCIIA